MYVIRNTGGRYWVRTEYRIPMCRDKWIDTISRECIFSTLPSASKAADVIAKNRMCKLYIVDMNKHIVRTYGEDYLA